MLALSTRTYVPRTSLVGRLKTGPIEQLVMPSECESALANENTKSVSFDDKISFLSAPEHYHEHAKQVTLLQTHHAWLFMTERHVFKMKKPSRQGGYDFSSLESRHWLCQEELRLNRRLARDTYLAVVPLIRNRNGGLELDGDGCPVEWLVKMARLPDSRMLLTVASQGLAASADIRSLMRKLYRFHESAPTFQFRAGGYVARLHQKIETWTEELLRPPFALPAARVIELSELLYAYVEAFAGLLEQRQRDGHIREGHGDLRPEHVFLVENAEPEIIDCLEFDINLRRLDSAEEIAFLAMECRHAGQSRLARACYNCYRSEYGRAAVPGHLWDFYAALGAMARAGVSAWRIPDPTAGERSKRKAIDYLNDARHHIALAQADR